MTKNKRKFSDIIIDLSEIWTPWLKYNELCKDDTLSIKQRKEAADMCEKLIDRRYELINEIDAFFSSRM